MRSLIDRNVWWPEQRRMLLLKLARFPAILAGEGYYTLPLPTG